MLDTFIRRLGGEVSETEQIDVRGQFKSFEFYLKGEILVVGVKSLLQGVGPVALYFFVRVDDVFDSKKAESCKDSSETGESQFDLF